MRCVTYCAECGGTHIDYMGNDKWFCIDCNKEVETRDKYVYTPFERTRNAVYATGNRWAIENFNATHY